MSVAFTNAASSQFVNRLSNTSWVAWDEENNRPLIDEYAGQDREQTIEIQVDGRCVSGIAQRWTGEWTIRELAGHPYLYLLFGNIDDNFAITVLIISEYVIWLSSAEGPKCYRKCPFTPDGAEARKL